MTVAVRDGVRHPVKKPKGGELAVGQQAFNVTIHGIHAAADRTDALLRVTCKALRRAGLDPGTISRIARAALVMLQLEHGRTA